VTGLVPPPKPLPGFSTAVHRAHTMGGCLHLSRASARRGNSPTSVRSTRRSASVKRT
jgi:hypothetical protein